MGIIIAMTEDNFKEKLTPDEYHILREGGTEAPFTGKYWNEHAEGTYRCRACGAELFSSDTKFDSGTGWPSFTSPAKISQGENSAGGPAHRANVELREDSSLGMSRVDPVQDRPAEGAATTASGRSVSNGVEVCCRNCGSHLGHVFDDGPKDRSLPAGMQGKRYCINSACLELEKET